MGSCHCSHCCRLTKDEIVNRALEKFLPKFKFLYLKEGKRHGQTSQNMTGPHSSSIMVVKKNPSISLNPNKNGTILCYGEVSTSYTLHLGYYKSKNCKAHLLKLVYHSEATNRIGTKDTLTSPYYPCSIKGGCPVPCAPPVDITRALMDRNPVTAVVKEMKTSFQHLKGDNYLWEMLGEQEEFYISTVGMNSTLYWGGIGTTVNGNIKFTNKNKNLLKLMLEEPIDPP